jgi:serine/threonine protein kinase
MQLLLELLRRAAQAEPEVEIRIPNYEIERKIGEGGMGAVYLVRHTKDNTHAALKVMLARIAVDTNKREEFQREMKATRALQHKYIVKFLESGAAGSIFYFLLEYCNGGCMFDLMRQRGGRVSIPEGGLLLLQALEGLAYVHAHGFVHRDLKPHNILLSGTGWQRVAKVADLGLAKNFEQAGLSGMTVTGNFAGSFPYMPREQVTDFKYFKPVSDVWAMGATFYHILTGQFPRNYRAKQDPLEMVLSGAVVPIRQRDPSIPSPIARVIDRALADEVENRYQDAGEMYQEFARALQKVK